VVQSGPTCQLPRWRTHKRDASSTLQFGSSIIILLIALMPTFFIRLEYIRMLLIKCCAIGIRTSYLTIPNNDIVKKWFIISKFQIPDHGVSKYLNEMMAFFFELLHCNLPHGYLVHFGYPMFSSCFVQRISELDVPLSVLEEL
jgi:hypothetical protein